VKQRSEASAPDYQSECWFTPRMILFLNKDVN